MSEKKYSKEHEWIELNGNIATIGITNHAQESLGDIVFVELPVVGKKVAQGEEVCVVESVKAASDIFSPIGGKIVEINNILKDNGSLINEDPENKGWIFKLESSNLAEIKNLMSSSEYINFLKEE